MPKQVRRFQSSHTTPRQAVREFRDGVWQSDAEFVVFFCSSLYPLDEIADEIQQQFGDTKVFGCTTAGEIGPKGYVKHSISGASFPKDAFTATGCVVQDLRNFEFSQARTLVRTHMPALTGASGEPPRSNVFALSLIDGLSTREEIFTRALQNALGDIPLVGGSAGDDLRFARTHIYADGRFFTDAAIVLLVATSRPFRTFKIQNFQPAAERLVVTEADAATRTVQEINGLPAIEEYARITEADPHDLRPEMFAESPVVVLVDGSNYVRAVQKANSDGSLTFYSAVDEGMILRPSRGVDMVDDLQASIAGFTSEIGPAELTLSFDCILRRLNAEKNGTLSAISEIFTKNSATGFCSYGEQYNGIHVNYTLTGILIGTST